MAVAGQGVAALRANEMLHGQLQAKIQKDSDLTLRRNIQQIQSQARERAANMQGLDGPAEPDAQTFNSLINAFAKAGEQLVHWGQKGQGSW